MQLLKSGDCIIFKFIQRGWARRVQGDNCQTSSSALFNILKFESLLLELN